MKIRNTIGCFAVLIVLGLLVMPVISNSNAHAADKVIKWRMQVLWDAATLPYKIEKTFVDRVKELSDGRMEIKIFAPGSLVPTNQMLDAIQKGMFEMTISTRDMTLEGCHTRPLPAPFRAASLTPGNSIPGSGLAAASI